MLSFIWCWNQTQGFGHDRQAFYQLNYVPDSGVLYELICLFSGNNQKQKQKAQPDILWSGDFSSSSSSSSASSSSSTLLSSSPRRSKKSPLQILKLYCRLLAILS